MPARSGRYARPLLGIRRATTRQACLDAGLSPWDDPHNVDPAYTRVRVRERVLPVLEAELGPGIAEALARTAEQLREDDEAFTEPDRRVHRGDLRTRRGRHRGLRRARSRRTPPPCGSGSSGTSSASEFGVSLSRAQTLEVARLVTDWHGQGPLDLPGGVHATRAGRHVVFSTTGSTEVLPHDH